MRVGTRSVLFGVHQFLLHPLFVLVAWWRLYGRPSWAEVMAILVHDAGYWGAKDLEGPSGLLHPERGARLLKWLGFGSYAVSLVRRHSRSYAERIGLEPSRLCWADKFSFVLEPAWFYLLRARLSGELVEYRHKAAAAGLVPLDASDLTWFHAVWEALYWEVAEATVDEGVQRLFHEYWWALVSGTGSRCSRPSGQAGTCASSRCIRSRTPRERRSPGWFPRTHGAPFRCS